MVGVKDQVLRVKLGYDIDCEKPNPLRARFQIFTFEELKTVYVIKLCNEGIYCIYIFTLLLAWWVCCSLFDDGYFWVASGFLHLPALRIGRGRCMDQGSRLYLL